jgi:thiosulfate dehydrogenase
MKPSQLLVLVSAIILLSKSVIAKELDWSGSTIMSTNEMTIRAYGFKYIPTPDAIYNIDFIFNETNRHFEPDMSTLIIINNNYYDRADMIRGGQLYDQWWQVNGEPQPTGIYESYPPTGKQTGSNTWRCETCHGWDYKGQEGVYETGENYTGIKGVYSVKDKSAAEIYEAILTKELSLSDQDIWDLTKFLREGQIDMNKYIIFSGSQSKSATGNVENGRILYESTGRCLECHGADGNKKPGVAVGKDARDNPWEILHKIRFGQPGTQMPSAVENGLTLQEQIDILTYAQTLSTE